MSAFRALPGHDDGTTTMVRIDIAHAYAIKGFGKDMMASCIVLLAIRLSVFGESRNLQQKLDLAFESFKSFCKDTSAYTSITEFSLGEFRVTSLLGGVGSGAPGVPVKPGFSLLQFGNFLETSFRSLLPPSPLEFQKPRAC